METTLAVAAIVISVATAVAEHLRWRREGGKVVVTASTAVVGPFEDGMMRSCVCVHAVNTGRGTAVVTSWGLIDPQGRFSVGPAGRWSHGPATPAVLSPESPEAFWTLDYQEQRTDLRNAHPGVPHTLQGFVRLPGNRLTRSKNRVSLGGTDAVRPTPRERWDGLRSAGLSGMAYRPGRDGRPHRLEVLATGPRPARALVVDVVRASDRGQEPLPDGAYVRVGRRRLRKGKVLHVPVPEAAFGHDLYFRVSWKSGGVRREFRSGIPERQALDAAATHARTRR